MRKVSSKRRKVTSKGKASAKIFSEAMGPERLQQIGLDVVRMGKSAIDGVIYEVGQLLVETIMYMEREEIAGPDYQPLDPKIQKGGTQQGFAYIGDQKVGLRYPRVRGPQGEIPLETYHQLKQKDGFSMELLGKSLNGLAGRRYEDVVTNAAGAYGVSKSSFSRKVVEATIKQLKEFQERDLSDFRPFAVFLDTIHRGGSAFVVALGMNLEGNKKPLGFWEGATENHDVCEELLADLERRGLKLSRFVIYVTDGGKGIIKALKDKFGKKLVHQRCTIHKDRNIQRHLPKKYRKEAHAWFTKAINCVQYNDAKRELNDMEAWLRRINISAANSLKEAADELLTLHRLRVPELLLRCMPNVISSLHVRCHKLAA